jgi:hypothetical protein
VPHLLRHGLIRRTAPFSRLLHVRYTRGCGVWRSYSNPDPHGFPFSRLLRHTRGCGGPILTLILTGPHSVASYNTQGGVGGPILTWILMGPHSVASYNTQGGVEGLFKPESSWVSIQSPLTTHKGVWGTYSNLDPHGSPFSRLL